VSGDQASGHAGADTGGHASGEPLPATIEAALALAHRLGVARLDAQWLLAHHLARPRGWLLAHGDEALPSAAAGIVVADLARRADGVPLAYLTGRRGFHGLELQVTPAVLDPRPDTETLVDWALSLLDPDGALAGVPAPRVADLGTGSGAIALAVRHGCPRAQVHGTDLSADALAVAAANAGRLALPVTWHRGPWWQALPLAAGPWHLTLSNPPYIAAGDPHLPALRHEPPMALVPPDGDGLSALREIVRGAPARLAPGGWLLLEHGFDQADAVAALLHGAGFAEVQHRLDLGGHRRCTGGRWPGPQVLSGS
jgi:release factor glutamine methyltransferase